MTTPLVERLKDEHNQTETRCRIMCRESADRIERLEKALRESIKTCRHCGGGGSVEKRRYDAASDEMEWDGYEACGSCRDARKALEET